ncbi:hypothetical protein EDB89DRAFT_2183478 [Lactarius sanguifluus]|nr:hypothetical protein EDB89DRAFT_2183478 [Lactarius sanguifluus]
MPAWWWRRVVDGRGWAMMWVAMSERKKRKKKKGLNKVGSQGRIMAVGGGVGMTSRRCLRVARWCGGGMAWLTVGGLGCDVGGDERNKKKTKKERKQNKNALNDVGSRAGGVGGNVGQSKRKGLVGSELVWWWALQIALRVSSWRILSARPSSSSSCVSQQHGVGAELSRGGVPVVEIDGDGVRNDTKKKKPLPISSLSAAVLGGFAQRGDDGGELEATAGAMG